MLYQCTNRNQYFIQADHFQFELTRLYTRLTLFPHVHVETFMLYEYILRIKKMLGESEILYMLRSMG